MKSFLCLIAVLLSGCGLLTDESRTESAKLETEKKDDILNTAEIKPDLYFQKSLISDVNDYAKWLMQDLISNLDLPSNEDVFIVTDIALLDSDLNKTNHFGRQFTEALIHEVNRAGFSVIDVKNRGFIRFNDQGDVFYQTRDFTEVPSNLDVSNVLTGTMTRHQGGYLINAKIIDANTGALISSGQILIPHYVVEAVMQEVTIAKPTEQNSIKLKAYDAKN